MQSVFLAMLAEFIQFQPIFQNFFIFSGKIVNALANRALHFYQIIL